MKKEKIIKLNIAFKVPDEVARASIMISQKLSKKEDAFFVLDNVNYFPHITCYSIEFPESNIEKVIEVIDDISNNFSPVEFRYKKNEAVLGWVAVYFEYHDELRKLHSRLIKELSPLRYKNEVNGSTRIDEGTPDEERINIENYGRPHIMNTYNPHLTITRLKDYDVVEKTSTDLIWKINKFTSDSIGIFVSGEHGTCIELIRDFKIRSD